MAKTKKNQKDKNSVNNNSLKRDFVSYAEIEAEKMSKDKKEF
jgi:hypothetical protein